MIALVITIHGQYITLAQLLKMANVVQSGGEAKFFLAQNVVYVNGQIDSRRGRKLYEGDTVEIDGHSFTVQGLQ